MMAKLFILSTLLFIIEFGICLDYNTQIEIEQIRTINKDKKIKKRSEFLCRGHYKNEEKIEKCIKFQIETLSNN